MRLISCFLFFVVLASCGSSKVNFIDKHLENKISLQGFSEQIKIGYETEKAIIYFGKQNAIALTSKLIKSKKIQKFVLEDIENGQKRLKGLAKDTTVMDWQLQKNVEAVDDYLFAGFIDQWLLEDLINSGKVKILNKETNVYVKRVTSHFTRDKLGGETRYYTFSNGVEFHSQIIAFGE